MKNSAEFFQIIEQVVTYMNTYKHLFWISQACQKNNIFLEFEYGSFEIHFSLCTATENDTRNTGQTFMKRYVVGTNRAA